jgi:galactonate dehydratase
VYTNQGIVGLGEGTLTGKEATVEQAILEHKRYLVGKDPTDIEAHWQGMFRGPRYRGGPVLMSALSAVEIALWDVLGQALGQPIWKLLGGKARDRVRIYPHAGGRTPEQCAQAFLKRKEEGWTACKSGFLGTVDGNIIDPARSVREAIEKLKAVRKAVGDDFDICIDLHGKATTPMAVEFCVRAEEYRPMFVEEATQLEDLGELAHLRSKTRVPLATGERQVSRFDFNEICSQHLVDYVQPDVVHCGGILEMKKIGIMAEAFRIQLAPHNPQSEVSTVASLHVNMCTPNATILEIGSGQSDTWKDLFYGGIVSFEKGYAQAPDRPGLGINLDEMVAARFPYRPKDWHAHSFSDGSIADR